MSSILQWNCNGLSRHYEELKVLITENKINIICLQETHLRPNSTFNLHHFTSYHTNHINNDKACGGVAIFVSDDFISTPIQLNTRLQAVAVKVSSHLSYTLCNIYLPPRERIISTEIENLLSQLPSPFCVVGDFNAHHNTWGSSIDSTKGKTISNIIDSHNLILLNTGASTHFSAAFNSSSAIDLSICSPQLAPFITWESNSFDLCGSDHFPIFIQIKNNTPQDTRTPRWLVKRANWHLFAELSVFNRNEDFPDINSQVCHLTSVLLAAANASIPRTRTNPPKRSVSWWSEECKLARCRRRRALREFRRRPTAENLITFKRENAKAKRVFKESKQNSWRAFVSSINSHTSSSDVWKSIKRISGASSSHSVPGLMVNKVMSHDPDTIVNCFAEHFSATSHSQHYDKSFLQYKTAQEKQNLNFSTSEELSYNVSITDWELQSVLQTVSSTSPGPDDIHYFMLQHLSDESRLYLLSMYNRIWLNKTFPSSWKLATVIPIAKPGKDNKLPTSYRPIALTSCLCKILEKIINRRLVWFLEKYGLLSNIQCGFRRHRSTTDHLVQLESEIQNTFLQKQHMVGIFFDLEKAYDTTWRFAILKTLHSWGMRGNLPIFITAFLQDRIFKVRCGNTYSRTFHQENGVPQGSVLSVTLFGIAINSIAKSLPPYIGTTLFVDDFSIFFRSPLLASIQEKLQLALCNLEIWSKETGFRFSVEKTVCVHFTRLRGIHPHPELKLNNSVLPYVENVRYLGLIFDHKLTWKQHILDLKRRCNKALNLIRVLGHTSWGADRTSLLRIYRSIVRSKLDYGSIVYDSARPSYIRSLETIHNQGVRMSTGAFRTSPILSLLAECGEPSLEMRRKYLMTCYAATLHAQPDHPTYISVFEPRYAKLFASHPKATRPLGIRLTEYCKENNVTFPPPFLIEPSLCPPWLLNKPQCNVDLTVFNKTDTPPEIFRQHFRSAVEPYRQYIHIYTDASQSNSGTGCAVVAFDSVLNTLKYRLNKFCNVFTGELIAIYKALRYINDHLANQFIIFSDSLSSLQSLVTYQPRNPLVSGIQDCLYSLQKRKKTVILFWVPGHVGIRGNEMADAAAKQAILLTDPPDHRVPAQDYKPHLRKHLFSSWLHKWRELKETNKLRVIKDTISEWTSSRHRNRRSEVVLARLRIGHTRFTHVHLLTKDQPPLCNSCQEPVTVKHILIDCPIYSAIRKQYHLSQDLSVLLSDDVAQVQNLIQFIKHIGFYSVI